MKTYKFKVKEHEEYGSLGFAPTWYPEGEPFQGMTVAHDIMEHFPKDEGGAEGEFMALGVAYRLRGETGYMQKNGNPHSTIDHISSDIPQIFFTISNTQGHTRIRPAPKKCRIPSKVRDDFWQVVYAGHRLLREEYGQGDLLNRADREHIVNWMAMGYQQAGKRYKGMKFYDLAWCVFDQISEQADKALKYVEEGMELTVRVDFKNMEVRMNCDYPEEDYYQ